MSSGEISVVIPVHNAMEFLPRAVGSVMGQTYQNIELILVDDGSVDGSWTMCVKFAQADPRIRAITQANKGPAAARNAGMRIATGEFVFFLDADDYIEEDALQTLMEPQGYDMMMSNFAKLSPDGRLVGQPASFHPDDPPFTGSVKSLPRYAIDDYVRHFLRHPSNHLISYCWARLYRMDIIRKYGIEAPEDMRLFEDFVFNLEYLKHVDHAVFINKPLYVYVQHGDHVSASMAPFNGGSLVHDMESFKSRAIDFLLPFHPDGYGVEREAAHTVIHYAIILLVRSCRLLTKANRKRMAAEIAKVLRSSVIRGSLRHYAPSPGDSAVLPVLMWLKWTWPLMLVCRRKAYKRYGRPSC